MERLTLNKRPKTGDKLECLPGGDGLPIWTTIPLDAKLPMMKNPKGSVVLYTTKLGEPKHRCKQEFDFDLRDPNGQYIVNEYQPLHDPHLKYHFSTQAMRRHLIRHGYLSEDGRVLCSLKEFNQYRQYLRHIFFLEIARDRKDQLDLSKSAEDERRASLQKAASRGTVVRRRLQKQRDQDMTKLKKNIVAKTDRLETRLQEVRDELVKREKKQREEADRRQQSVAKNQQETEQRTLMLIKKWRQRERMRTRLMEDRDSQRLLRAEIRCMTKWNARKQVQKAKLDMDECIIHQEEAERMLSIIRRDKMVSKQREMLNRKIEKHKQQRREEKEKRDERCTKRFEEKLASGDYTVWGKRKDKRRRFHNKKFESSWKWTDVLNSMEVTDENKDTDDPSFIAMLNDAMGDDKQEPDAELQERAREIVQNVFANVKRELYPQSTQGIDEPAGEAVKSRSVRFSTGDESMSYLPKVVIQDSMSEFKPVTEHVLTPCPSQLEIQKLEAEAILGSPVDSKTSSVSFVETLLLRLLDDLNSGRLTKEDIMKLASYSMDIIQSTEAESQKDNVIVEAPDENEEGPYLASSSSSIIAKKMVDFTLSKILSDIQSGNVHHDDLASLTVSLMDNTALSGESSACLIVSEEDLDAYIQETIKGASSAAFDPRQDSPVCDALLDDFMVKTLKTLIQDLEAEALTTGQIISLAASVKEETKRILPAHSDIDIKQVQDIQKVLQDILMQLQSGVIDLQTLYQIVFAIVYSYNQIKSPPTPCFESRITDLMRDLLNTVEQKASVKEMKDINIDIVHEANMRLSTTALDVSQIEQMSTSILSVLDQPEVICKTSSSEIARSIVEEALCKAKDKLGSENTDVHILQGVQNVAEALIYAVPSDSSKPASPPLVDLFVDVLEGLKTTAGDSGAIEHDEIENIQNLIDQISSRDIHFNQVTEIATSVVRVLKSPVKSQSSFAANLMVKDVLSRISADLSQGSLEDNIIKEMIKTVTMSCRAAKASDCKSPALLTALSAFLKTILGHVTYKVECGDFNEKDIAELSMTLKESIEQKSNKIATSKLDVDQPIEDITQDNQTETHPIHTASQKNQTDAIEINYAKSENVGDIFSHLNRLLDQLETGEHDTNEIAALGKRLVECGTKLKAQLSSKSSDLLLTPNTDLIAEDVVEEVIRTLQLEIDSGMLTKESLKEITMTILSSTSDSDIASDIVGNVMKGITRDVSRGYDPTKIPSVPTLDHSPSASTIASHIVMYTIDGLNRDLEMRGLRPGMVTDIATSIIAIICDVQANKDNLQEQFNNVRHTVKLIVDYLKRDEINQTDAEHIFCVILEQYRKHLLKKKIPTPPVGEQLSDDDVTLIDDLVTETLKNIERSVKKGRMDHETFSIPSMPHSDDSSVIAEGAIEACLAGIKQSIAEANMMPAQTKTDIVDFVIEIVTGLQVELLEGTISNLSMAHFYQSISTDNKDLRTLEANAPENLASVINDLKQHRSGSEFLHRILELYLVSDEASEGLFSDPVKAIEAILVSVSSEILTKFVKATLQNILIEMREGTGSIANRAPSVYVLRSASSMIAENVIHEVINRITHDMTKSVHRINGGVSKQKLERAASRLLCETPSQLGRRSTEAVVEKLTSVSRQSMSSILSKEVEDIVLETLHNIVSNLRLEQSMQPKRSQQQDAMSEGAQEIQDFVLQTLQTIVTDQQDKRSQVDIDATRGEGKYGDSSIELVSGDSKTAAAYVNEVLQHVLDDMKSEMEVQDTVALVNDGNSRSDQNSGNLETVIVDCLRNVLTDTNPLFQPTLDSTQHEDVKMILMESIEGTIHNISDNRFSQADMYTMQLSLQKFLHTNFDVSGIDNQEQSTEVDAERVIVLFKIVLDKISDIDLDNEILNRLSTQIATIGMESLVSERTSLNNISSEASVTSTEISELVKDVIVRMSQQLVDEMNNQSDKNNDSGSIKSRESIGSLEKKDVNYNRRVSASSCRTTSTCLDGYTNDSVDAKGMATLNEADVQSKTVTIKQKGIYAKRAKSPKKTTNEKKLSKRTNEPRPVIKKQTMPSKISTSSPNERCKSPSNAIKQKQTPDENSTQRASIIRSYIDTSFPQTPKTVLDATTPKRYADVKHSKSERKTVINVPKTKPTSSSVSYSTPSMKKVNNSKRGIKGKGKSNELTNMNINDIPRKPTPPLEKREHPLELKSICGSHKTKIKLRETGESTTPRSKPFNTDDDDHVTCL